MRGRFAIIIIILTLIIATISNTDQITRSRRMTTSPINIVINCEGSFVIDSEGVRSTKPVALKKTYWDNNTLHLEGQSSNIGIISDNIVVRGNSFNVVNSVGFSGCSFDNNNVIINGVRYKPVDDQPKVSNEIFNEPWSKTGRGDVVLEGISTSGNVNIEVLIPLEESCDIDSSGTSNISIQGDNPESSLTISLSGMGSVRGNTTVKKLSVSLSGMGNINGFTALKQLRAKASGMGNINVRSAPGCIVTKNKSGMASINISSV